MLPTSFGLAIGLRTCGDYHTQIRADLLRGLHSKWYLFRAWRLARRASRHWPRMCVFRELSDLAYAYLLESSGRTLTRYRMPVSGYVDDCERFTAREESTLPFTFFISRLDACIITR